MKTEKLVKTIKCDQCEKEVSDNGEKSFGKSHFYGWIHLSINNGSSYIGDLDKKTEFDFCSMECLNKFSSKKEPKTFPLAGERTENSFKPKTKIYDGMFNEIDKNGNVIFFTSKVY